MNVRLPLSEAIVRHNYLTTSTILLVKIIVTNPRGFRIINTQTQTP